MKVASLAKDVVKKSLAWNDDRVDLIMKFQHGDSVIYHSKPYIFWGTTMTRVAKPKADLISYLLKSQAGAFQGVLDVNNVRLNGN